MVNSGRHDSPHIRESSLDHDSGEKKTGCQSADNIYVITIYIHIGVVNSGRHDSPHIRKSSLDHDSGEKIGVSVSFSDIFHVSRLYQCNPHVSSRTASLAIIVPTRPSFFEISKSQKSEHDS